MPKIINTNKTLNQTEVPKEILRKFHVVKNTTIIPNEQISYISKQSGREEVMENTYMVLKAAIGFLTPQVRTSLNKNYNLVVSNNGTMKIQLQKGMFVYNGGPTGDIPLETASNTSKNVHLFWKTYNSLIKRAIKEYERAGDMLSQDEAQKQDGILGSYLAKNSLKTALTDANASQIAANDAWGKINEITKVINGTSQSEDWINFWNGMDQVAKDAYLKELTIVSNYGRVISIVDFMDTLAAVDNQQWKIVTEVNDKGYLNIKVIFN